MPTSCGEFIYPRPATAYEDNADMAVKRIFSQLYWLKNNCPVPWMIGETGFSAIDDDIGTAVHQYPEVMGELENPLNGEVYTQKNFAEVVIKMVRDCGGAGFSMWQFQEVHWVPENSPSGRYHENAWGLLRHGPTSPYIDINKKPVVEIFETYLVNGQPPPPDPGAVQIPSNYYDPFNTRQISDDYFGANTIPDVTGTITDQDGNNIKDAYVLDHVFTGQFLDDINPGAPHYPLDNKYYTFTNDNQTGANYSLTPFESVTGDAQRQYIRWLEVSATGCSKEEANNFGWYGTGANSNRYLYYNASDYASPPLISQSDFTLRSITTPIDREIQNEIINNTNSPATFAARLSLNASVNNEIQSGGIADFYALNEVHITDVFHAATGSEVHIYNAPLFTDCDNDFPNPVFRLANQGGSVNHTATSSLELQFVMEGDELRIIPNPNTGIFILKFSGNTTDQKQLKCFDLMGKLIMSQQLTELTVQLNLSTAPKGMYYLQVSSENKTYSQKLIIQ